MNFRDDLQILKRIQPIITFMAFYFSETNDFENISKAIRLTWTLQDRTWEQSQYKLIKKFNQIHSLMLEVLKTIFWIHRVIGKISVFVGINIMLLCNCVYILPFWIYIFVWNNIFSRYKDVLINHKNWKPSSTFRWLFGADLSISSIQQLFTRLVIRPTCKRNANSQFNNVQINKLI